MSQTQVREEACGIALPGTPADKRPLAPKSGRQADPDPGSVFVERTLKRKAAAMDAGQGRLRGRRWVRTADLHGKSRHHEWSQASGGSNSSSRSVQLPCVYVHESFVRRRCGDSRGVSVKSLTHTAAMTPMRRGQRHGSCPRTSATVMDCGHPLYGSCLFRGQAKNVTAL